MLAEAEEGGRNMEIFFHKNVVNADDVLDHYDWDTCLAFKGPQGDNILHTAARDGSLKIINRVHESESARSLLLSGRNSEGETPLHLAAEYGSLEVVQSILSMTNSEYNENSPYAIVNIEPVGDHVKPWRIKSANGDTPAHKAIRQRRIKVALLLLQRDPELITILNNARESLLYLAADSNSYEVITAILSEDREYDDSITSGRSGENFFHAAARSPGFYKMKCTSLIKKQLHLIQKVDDNGKTPLHHAIQEARDVTAGWLLQQDKSAAFVYDNEGLTPLLRAAVLGESTCIRQILTLCPQSAKLRDLSCNRTVLHLTNMHRLYHQFCMRHDVLKNIVNEIDKYGNTALHCAIIVGDVDKALVLLETQGINWTIRNNEQKSPRDLTLERLMKGDTRQRPISIALAALYRTAGINPVGSCLKNAFLAFNNMILTDENLKKLLENIAVAAALLVTITFAAAFTIPGGYDQNTGEAMAMKKAAIRVFIGSDVLAMLMAISILIRYTLGGRSNKLGKLATDCIIMLQISLMATIVSFISGVFAIGWHDKFIIIFPIVIAALLNLFFIFRKDKVLRFNYIM
ncbi:hypothetical protein V2J09_017407 [Rumex salicifolius]